MGEYIKRKDLAEMIGNNVNLPYGEGYTGKDHELVEWCKGECIRMAHCLPFVCDVVPKSEVEKLIGKFECFLCHVTGGRLSKHTYDLRTMETVATDCINETYNDGFGEGYKECAREIFEEIEKILAKNIGWNSNTIAFYKVDKVDDAIAELKKKYTEGET